jgi:hypothetical protein
LVHNNVSDGEILEYLKKNGLDGIE